MDTILYPHTNLYPTLTSVLPDKTVPRALPWSKPWTSGDDGVFHLCHLGKVWLPCPTVLARAKNAKNSKGTKQLAGPPDCHWIKQRVCNRDNSIKACMFKILKQGKTHINIYIYIIYHFLKKNTSACNLDSQFLSTRWFTSHLAFLEVIGIDGGVLHGLRRKAGLSWRCRR